MAYEPELETGETVRYRAALNLSKKAQPFHFAVSDRAVYWPAIKLVAVSDPFYFRRLTNNQIQEVSIRRLPPYGFWILAGLMVIGGLTSTVFMVQQILAGQTGEHNVSGWPIAVLVGGFILPFAAQGRHGLQITTSEKTFRWKPPLVVDKPSKDQVAATLDGISAACQASGLRVRDERQKIAAQNS
jgi:hypothetical protein